MGAVVSAGVRQAVLAAISGCALALPASLTAQTTPPLGARAGPPPGPLLRLPAGQTTSADRRLLEAIDHYTGVAGRVDDERARALLMDASVGDDVLARMWIARSHSRGRMGFERDEVLAGSIAAEAIDDVQALAAASDIEALFLMGTAYDEGLGVPVDHAEAMRWYRRSADRGHVLATHNVGNMYWDGRGVEADLAAGIRWWLRAARAGDAIPALRLGEAFEAGTGVTRDLQTARFWYGRSAERGNPDAAEALRRLAR